MGFPAKNTGNGEPTIEPVCGTLLCHDIEYISMPSIILLNVEYQTDAVLITPDETH